MHNTWPSNACAKSSGYSGELQGSDYGNLLLKLRLACATVASGVPSSKIRCATQAAHNCIPACVSCERARGCSGELQGSDNGNLLLKPCWVCANVVFSTLGTCLTQAAHNCKPASKTCENSVCYSAELQGSDYGN